MCASRVKFYSNSIILDDKKHQPILQEKSSY